MPETDSLRLRVVQDQDDLQRLGEFNQRIHGEETLNRFTSQLVEAHPTGNRAHFPFIEDTQTGDIVSTLCLIPWQLQWDGVLVKVAEMGIVGTDEAYRKQGLMRRLNAYFERLVQEGGYDLCMIQGIPYFYRQFGYEYTLPLEGGYRLDLRFIADEAPDLYHIEPAEPADAVKLMALAEEHTRYLDIVVHRDVSVWVYMLDEAFIDVEKTQFYVVRDVEARREDSIIGYVRLGEQGMAEGLHLNEASYLPAEAIPAVMAFARKKAQYHGYPCVRMNLPATHPLVQLAPDAHHIGNHAWQMMIPRPEKLLQKMRPLFERRLADSPYRHYTGDYVIHTYGASYALQFKQGLLRDVVDGKGRDADLSLPKPLLAPLLSGQKTHRTLRDATCDVAWRKHQEALTGILFPPLQGFIYGQY